MVARSNHRSSLSPDASAAQWCFIRSALADPSAVRIERASASRAAFPSETPEQKTRAPLSRLATCKNFFRSGKKLSIPPSGNRQVPTSRCVDVGLRLITPCRCEQSDLLEFLERSEEHTSELQSRFGISYAVFCLKKTS